MNWKQLAESIRNHTAKDREVPPYAADLCQAIMNQPEPPCTGCKWYALCKNNELACERFLRYTLSQSQCHAKTTPNRYEFLKIYAEGLVIFQPGDRVVVSRYENNRFLGRSEGLVLANRTVKDKGPQVKVCTDTGERWFALKNVHPAAEQPVLYCPQRGRMMMNDQAVSAEVLLDCGQEVTIIFSATDDEPLDEAAMREATERGLRPASVISIDFCEHNEGAER
jgi:hypothetical protein